MYQIYITANNGEDVTQELMQWDGEDRLELRLSAYANDAVISVEPGNDSKKKAVDTPDTHW